MVDGQNKDVLQDLSDQQRKVAEAQPEPVNEPEPVATTTPPPAARSAGVKKEPAPKI
jgi:hypothetical protein